MEKDRAEAEALSEGEKCELASDVMSVSCLFRFMASVNGCWPFFPVAIKGGEVTADIVMKLGDGPVHDEAAEPELDPSDLGLVKAIASVPLSPSITGA